MQTEHKTLLVPSAKIGALQWARSMIAMMGFAHCGATRLREPQASIIMFIMFIMFT